MLLNIIPSPIHLFCSLLLHIPLNMCLGCLSAQTPRCSSSTMWPSKIHNLVGRSSQEEKSVQGLSSFFGSSFVYLQSRDKLLCDTTGAKPQESLSQFPASATLSAKPPTQSPLSLGFSQGHTLCSPRRRIWLVLRPSHTSPPEPAGFTPTLTSSQNSSAPTLPLPEPARSRGKQRARASGRDLGAGWTFPASYYFAACFPKPIVGAF